MLKTLHILSSVTKFIFYGMMVYFLVLVAGILSGSYRFAETNTTLFYMILASGMATASLLLKDLHGFLSKSKSRIGMGEVAPKPEDHTDSVK